MIIWIDGTNGVGKSHVAEKLAKLLANKNAEYIESDLYWIYNNYFIMPLKIFLCEKNSGNASIFFVIKTYIWVWIICLSSY